MPRQHPPKPRFALSVGIIGHRPNRVAADSWEKITAQMGFALEAIRDAATDAFRRHGDFFSDEAPVLSVVTSLAEGSDRIGATAGLSRGLRLEVTLPFKAQDYEADFADQASVQQFRQLLSTAASILEIPGERARENLAYEHAGLAVIDQSDILITVWDGKPAAGRGGTADFVHEAALKGIPIIRIDPAPASPMRVHWREPGGRSSQRTYFDREYSETEDGMKSAVALAVAQIVRPPKSHEERSAMQNFLRQTFRPFNLYAPFPFLMAVLGVRGLRASDFFRNSPDGAAQELAKAGTAPNSVTAAYAWADECAVYFGQAFRGAFILNFVLAAMVTILVTFGLHPPYSALEIILIALLVFNTSRGRKRRWHELWIQSREVAERIRVSMLIFAVGSRAALPSGDVPAWTTWYVRAIMRQAGLRNAVLDTACVCAIKDEIGSFLESQKQYHQATARRFGAIHERLASVGKWLFYFTLSISLTVFAVEFLGLAHITPKIQGWIVVICAGLPALGAASYGIRVIGDFDGTASRSARMVFQLEALIRRLHSATPNFEILRDVTHRAAEIMQGDVASWRLVVESRELDMPG